MAHHVLAREQVDRRETTRVQFEGPHVESLVEVVASGPAQLVEQMLVYLGYQVAQPVRVGEQQTIRFDDPGRYRRYLLWITKLPEGNKAALQELTLYR